MGPNAFGKSVGHPSVTGCFPSSWEHAPVAGKFQVVKKKKKQRHKQRRS
jgi:hypothetical protein